MSNRRTFITACSAALPAASLLAADEAEKPADSPKLYPLPPGAVSLKRFKSKCTACHLCVSHCPSQVLQPSILENGLSGFMTPVMKYDVHTYCDFECTACMDVCPNNALVQVPLEEKKLIQVGIARLDLDNCLVIKNNEDCGACAEHCPTAALQMVPYKEGLTKPEIVSAERCIGCGGCESICPELKRAIYIERHDIQKTALPPVKEVQEEIEVDGFGF